jgi:hypothetical protein
VTAITQGEPCDLSHFRFIHPELLGNRGRVGKALTLSLLEWPGAKERILFQFIQWKSSDA